MFSYNYRIHELYRRPVASLVLLSDDAPGWRPDEFHYRLLGTDMGIRFPVAKVTDHAGHVGALLKNTNPFALITAAHLLTRQTRGLPTQRYAAKWRLIKLLYERGWNKKRIIDLFRVINWLMSLPDELEQKLWRNIGKLERRHKMEWISPLEQAFIDKGLKQGLEQGLEKGLERGARLGAARVLERQLSIRFGPLAKASIEELDHWSAALLEAATLKQVFADR